MATRLEEAAAYLHWVKTFTREQPDMVHDSLRRLVQSYDTLDRTAAYWDFRGERKAVSRRSDQS